MFCFLTDLKIASTSDETILEAYTKKYCKAEYVQRRVCFVNVQSSLHENIFIFDVVFSIYLMSRPNLLFTASQSDLKHLRSNF